MLLSLVIPLLAFCATKAESQDHDFFVDPFRFRGLDTPAIVENCLDVIGEKAKAKCGLDPGDAYVTNCCSDSVFDCHKAMSTSCKSRDFFSYYDLLEDIQKEFGCQKEPEKVEANESGPEKVGAKESEPKCSKVPEADLAKLEVFKCIESQKDEMAKCPHLANGTWDYKCAFQNKTRACFDKVLAKCDGKDQVARYLDLVEKADYIRYCRGNIIEKLPDSKVKEAQEGKEAQEAAGAKRKGNKALLIIGFVAVAGLVLGASLALGLFLAKSSSSGARRQKKGAKERKKALATTDYTTAKQELSPKGVKVDKIKSPGTLTELKTVAGPVSLEGSKMSGVRSGLKVPSVLKNPFAPKAPSGLKTNGAKTVKVAAKK